MSAVPVRWTSIMSSVSEVAVTVFWLTDIDPRFWPRAPSSGIVSGAPALGRAIVLAPSEIAPSDELALTTT
jgi:hypothetical protein